MLSADRSYLINIITSFIGLKLILYRIVNTETGNGGYNPSSYLTVMHRHTSTSLSGRSIYQGEWKFWKYASRGLTKGERSGRSLPVFLTTKKGPPKRAFPVKLVVNCLF